MLNVVDENGPDRAEAGRTLKGSDWTASVPFLQRTVETWALNNSFGGIRHE
jgi:hypothetical protein